MKLVYSPQAVADLSRLRNSIAEDNPQAARRIAAKLRSRIRQLVEFPGMGVAVEEAPAPADIRDMIFGDYSVRYSVHPHALTILRSWHHYEKRRGA